MNNKIIIALDFEHFVQAKQAVEGLPAAVFFKVGLQGFLEYGDAIIAVLREKGKKLFLDLKFHDIPNTVYGAVNSSLKYEPDFLTIHLAGGKTMAQKALEAASRRPGLTILGVTVLTSLADSDLVEMGMEPPAADRVLQLVEMGVAAGLKAFVCSPQEIAPLRLRFGKEIILVTPGIRPQWSEKGDQKRVFTPQMAMAAGSDYLVIGRPVTQDPDPAAAFARLVAEISRDNQSVKNIP
jgi:orotidine-5'-phosphate decarboxylase